MSVYLSRQKWLYPNLLQEFENIVQKSVVYGIFPTPDLSLTPHHSPQTSAEYFPMIIRPVFWLVTLCFHPWPQQYTCKSFAWWMLGLQWPWPDFNDHQWCSDSWYCLLWDANGPPSSPSAHLLQPFKFMTYILLTAFSPLVTGSRKMSAHHHLDNWTETLHTICVVGAILFSFCTMYYPENKVKTNNTFKKRRHSLLPNILHCLLISLDYSIHHNIFYTW